MLRILPDFELAFYFEQTRTDTIFGENMAQWLILYTLIAKPIRAVELHYQMIQFLIMFVVIFLDFHSTKKGLPLVDSWSRGLD